MRVWVWSFTGVFVIVPILAFIYLPAWAMAALIFSVLCLIVLFLQIRFPGMNTRIAIAMGLFALADFPKRLVYLLPGQSTWSQYLVFGIPYAYFGLTIVLPWAWELRRKRPSVLQIFVLVFTGWMLLNTWIGGPTRLVARLAASGLLLLPWTMLVVAADHPEADSAVAKTMIGISLGSLAYATWIALFGPTPIEVAWAKASSWLSIGAQNLTNTLYGNYQGGPHVLRPFGFQADSFTFSLLLLNALALTWLLYEKEKIKKWTAAVLGFIFLAGIVFSLVRTVWVAAAVLVIYTLLVRRFPVLARPWVVLPVMLISFFGTNLVALLLYQLRPLQALIKNPILQRMLTVGTLEARIDAVSDFMKSVPHLIWHGYGAAASSWITSKFGGFGSLPTNFSGHNVLVEYLWYFGLIGVLLLLVLFFLISQNTWRDYARGGLKRSTLALFAGYLLGLYFSGLANGSTFLNINFFFFMGLAMASFGKEQDVPSER
jgi:hypothetical protein